MEKQRYEELKWTEAPLYYGGGGVQEEGRDQQQQHADGGEKEQDERTTTIMMRQRLPLRAETTALLCVDVQPEYWSHCPSVRRDFGHFPDRLRQTVALCRDRGAKIIWVRADYTYQHSPWLAQFARLRGQTPGFLVEVPYTCNAAYHSNKNNNSNDNTDKVWEDFATPQEEEVIIPKTSWSSTSDTALKEILCASGIDTVLVCGLITSVCVQHSAFGVFEAGFRTLLVTDACADRGRARHEAALALYGEYMYELVTSQDLQHPSTGLLAAAAKPPSWLTLNSIHRCRGGSSSGVGGGDTVVSPLSSFGDLQNALHLVTDKKKEEEEKKGSSCKGSAVVDHENEETSTAPSSGTTSSMSEYSSNVY